MVGHLKGLATLGSERSAAGNRSLHSACETTHLVFDNDVVADLSSQMVATSGIGKFLGTLRCYR